MTERVRAHHETAADAPRLREQRGEDRPALVLGERDVVLVEEMIVQPAGVEAEVIGLEPRVPHLVVAPAHLRELDAEAERPPHPPGIGPREPTRSRSAARVEGNASCPHGISEGTRHSRRSHSAHGVRAPESTAAPYTMMTGAPGYV